MCLYKIPWNMNRDIFLWKLDIPSIWKKQRIYLVFGLRNSQNWLYYTANGSKILTYLIYKFILLIFMIPHDSDIDNLRLNFNSDLC